MFRQCGQLSLLAITFLPGGVPRKPWARVEGSSSATTAETNRKAIVRVENFIVPVPAVRRWNVARTARLDLKIVL